MKAINSKFMQPPAKGMIVKETIQLTPGHYYYHFAHSRVQGRLQSRERILGGAWWVDFNTFQTIRHRALQANASLTSVARQSMAVARQWGGTMDILVEALVRGPVGAFRGIGTIQTFDPTETDDQPCWIPAGDVPQLYVPGLIHRSPTTGNHLFADAFFHVKQTRLGWDTAP